MAVKLCSLLETCFYCQPGLIYIDISVPISRLGLILDLTRAKGDPTSQSS